MRKYGRIGFFILVMSGLAYNASAHTNSIPKDFDIQKLLSQGINFDHILFPYEGGKPFDATKLKTAQGKLKESEFAQVADLGFTHIRLNLGRGFLQESKPPYSLNPEGLNLLDQAVQMALRHQLGIVIDMHETPAPDIFHDAEAMKAYEILWKNLAVHYKNQPLSIVFELINEPAIPELFSGHHPSSKDLDLWRSIVKDLIEVIHKEDPKRYIVVSGGGWGDADNLLQMGNLKRPRLVYSFHYYSPFMFTHQGAGWMGQSLSTLRGIHYPVTKTQVIASWRTARERGYDQWPFQANPKGFTANNMLQNLKPLFNFAKKEGLVLYCGEFGVYKPYADQIDRARWIGDIANLLKKNNVDGAMWAYHAGFDLVDTEGRPDALILKALGLRVSPLK